jgi:hypothetical protein
MPEPASLIRELERVRHYSKDLYDPRSHAALGRYARDLEADLRSQLGSERTLII